MDSAAAERHGAAAARGVEGARSALFIALALAVAHAQL
jgi:hypothetical protein